MARRHRKQQRDIATPASGQASWAEASPGAAAGSGDRFRHLLLALAAAILVARPLVPSDGGPWIGDGQVAAALWIALAALWVVQSLSRPRLQVRFGWIDAAAVAFSGWWSVAALRGAVHSAPRPSINMLWEGVATLLAFLLLRQLVEPAAFFDAAIANEHVDASTGKASGTRQDAPGQSRTTQTRARQNSGRETRAMVAVMIAVGMMLAVAALYQYVVTMPANRQRFVEHPEAMFREAQMDVPAPGTQAYRSFADRLNSPEPYATFNLTNSLAAFLAPWLVIALGLALLGWQLRQRASRRFWHRLGIVACAILIAFALALTRSRSAWIGTVVGLGCIAVWWLFAVWCSADEAPVKAAAPRPRSVRWVRWIALAAMLLAMVSAVGVVVLFAVRPELRKPAARSFEVRLDYWRATCRMIADRPWWGVGPGNFGDYYTQYRLPSAWEDVRDPHNFALEIAASAGLPALVLFLAIVAGFAIRLRRRNRAARIVADGEFRTVAIAELVPRLSDGAWWIFGGALVGVWLALRWNLLLGFASWEEEAVVRMAIAGVTWWLLWPWIRDGRLSPWLCGIGMLVLLVALLAVGGITFGGVNETLWLLLALGLNAADSRQAAMALAHGDVGERGERGDGKKSLPWGISVALLVIVVGLWVSQYLTAYEPVLVSQGDLDSARAYAADGNDSQQVQELMQAAEADPLAVEPRRDLAILRFAEWLRGDQQGHRSGPFTSRLIGDFENWMNQALELEPQSASLRAEAGSVWQAIFEISRVPADGRNAVDLCRQAAELYPTGVAIQFELAQTLALTGDTAAAKAAAREALRLDELRPPAERALNDEQRKLAERIISGDNLKLAPWPAPRLGPPLPPGQGRKPR